MAKTALSLRKQGGGYVIDGIGTPGAVLTFDRGMRTGTITVDGRALPVAADGRLRTRVTLGGSDPLLCLDGQKAFVPGSGQPVQWRMSRPRRGHYQAALVRGPDLIDFSLARFNGKAVQISVGGEWDQLELIALAGCFAVLSRRRGDTYRAMAMAAVVSQHPR